VELSLRGTFAPEEWKVQELLFQGTFVPLELTFATEERMFKELSFHGTFTPVERSLHKELSCPLTFAPVELSLPYLKSCGKQGKQCFHRRMLTNVCCCLGLLVGLCVLLSTVLVQISE